MKLIIKYIDNDISVDNSSVKSIEIENKSYFYRIVNDLYKICNGETIEDIYLIDNHNNDINYLNKFKIFIDFFDFKLNSKKYTNDIIKYINKNIDLEAKYNLLTQYKKLINTYKKELNDIDLPIIIETEIDIETITRLIKITISQQGSLIENLFTLIDLENLFGSNSILVFVNLKQYLSRGELEELYKYSMYNEVCLLLIDSQSYGISLKNEQKLIIDENLDEFML